MMHILINQQTVSLSQSLPFKNNTRQNVDYFSLRCHPQSEFPEELTSPKTRMMELSYAEEHVIVAGFI